MKGRLGAPVIDELRLCYVAEPSLLEDLSGVEVGASVTISPFVLYRVGGDRFQYQFVVCLGDIGEREEVAIMKYGRYGAADSPYIYFRLSNQVLYNETRLKEVAVAETEAVQVKNNSIRQFETKLKAEQKKASAYKKLLKDAGVSEKRINSIIKVTDLSKVNLDDEGKVKDADKLTDNIKEEWSDFIETKSTHGATTANPATNVGGGKMSKEQIMAIKDTAERQKAMLDNKELILK